jgi:hypothetical protein
MRRLRPILLAILLFAMPAVVQASPVQDSLPAALGVDETLALGYGSIFDVFQPCASGVFRLGDETARAIEKNGITALDGLGNRLVDGSEWQYAPWTATPVDIESRESWSQNGYIWGGLACGLNGDWQATGQQIGTSPGAFYSFGDGVLLLVDPGRRIVIFTQRPSLH